MSSGLQLTILLLLSTQARPVFTRSPICAKWFFWDNTAQICQPCRICRGTNSYLDQGTCEQPVGCALLHGLVYECPKLSRNFTCTPQAGRYYLGTTCEGWCHTVHLSTVCSKDPYHNTVTWDKSLVEPCQEVKKHDPTSKPLMRMTTSGFLTVIATKKSKQVLFHGLKQVEPTTVMIAVSSAVGIMAIGVLICSLWILCRRDASCIPLSRHPFRCCPHAPGARLQTRTSEADIRDDEAAIGTTCTSRNEAVQHSDDNADSGVSCDLTTEVSARTPVQHSLEPSPESRRSSHPSYQTGDSDDDVDMFVESVSIIGASHNDEYPRCPCLSPGADYLLHTCSERCPLREPPNKCFPSWNEADALPGRERYEHCHRQSQATAGDAPRGSAIESLEMHERTVPKWCEGSVDVEEDPPEDRRALLCSTCSLPHELSSADNDLTEIKYS